jgi:hypothetical protein
MLKLNKRLRQASVAAGDIVDSENIRMLAAAFS